MVAPLIDIDGFGDAELRKMFKPCLYAVLRHVVATHMRSHSATGVVLPIRLVYL